MVGERILGRFVLEERLGAGGFGTVYRAWDERLERPVAVKAIETRGEAGRRVVREAQAAARLNHGGIVTLYELGQDDRHAYLVSELVEGATLRELAAEGALSDRDVADLGADLCEALAHAHDQGVVHRDIKPENVIAHEPDFPLPSGASRAKLMDFGTARLADEVSLTRSGEVIGTLAYMAPEQAEGSEAGPPADVYSLALTLYEAWSGRNPVARSSPAATARAVGEPLPPLAEQRPDLPRGLCATIDACLDVDEHSRPQLARLRSALLRAQPELDHREPVPEPQRSWSDRRSPLTPLRIAALALVPLLAPALGAIGAAPLYPALAGVGGGTARRSAAAGALGLVWLALFEHLPLSSDLLLAGALWAAAAVVFALLVRGRMVALGLLGVLVWAAGMVVLDRALDIGTKAPSGAAIALGALALAALALRANGAVRLPPRRARDGSPGAGMPLELGRAPRPTA